MKEPKIQIAIKGTHEAHNIYNPQGIAPTMREMYGKVTKIIQSDTSQCSQELEDLNIAVIV